MHQVEKHLIAYFKDEDFVANMRNGIDMPVAHVGQNRTAAALAAGPY